MYKETPIHFLGFIRASIPTILGIPTLCMYIRVHIPTMTLPSLLPTCLLMYFGNKEMEKSGDRETVELQRVLISFTPRSYAVQCGTNGMEVSFPHFPFRSVALPPHVLRPLVLFHRFYIGRPCFVLLANTRPLLYHPCLVFVASGLARVPFFGVFHYIFTSTLANDDIAAFRSFHRFDIM